jgi:hypothetical protein
VKAPGPGPLTVERRVLAHAYLRCVSAVMVRATVPMDS